MKKALIAIALFVAATFAATAQEDKRPDKRRKFSPEQFQEKQRNYITEKAALTPEEAEKFFPIFFELQKERFRIEREARSKVIKERGQKLTDEQWKELLGHTADARIAIAQLEKEYITKYLNVVSPKKLVDIQRAEHSFQSYMIKTMARQEKGGRAPGQGKRGGPFKRHDKD
jgi:Spy/CpxP family protein refolding chaperone